MTTTTINLRELAVEIDTILATLYEAKGYHVQRKVWAADALHRSAGHKKTGTNIFGHKVWDHDLSAALADVSDLVANGKPWLLRELDEYDRQCALIYQIDLEVGEAHEVYAEYQWRRAFLVTNANGHVHNGMSCSTCFPTTRYEWLIHYAAAEEDEIVRDAGELACTVCYPSAPSDYLNRPANLVSKTRQEKDAAKAARAAEKVEREAKRRAKAPTASGDPLVVPQDEWRHDNATLNTEITARKTWNGIEDAKNSSWQTATQQQIDAQDIIVRALAEKHGKTFAQQQAELKVRYAKRSK